MPSIFMKDQLSPRLQVTQTAETHVSVTVVSGSRALIDVLETDTSTHGF